MKTKKEKLKQNYLSSKKNRVANKNFQRLEQKKKHDAEKNFLRSKNFISVAKKNQLSNMTPQGRRTTRDLSTAIKYLIKKTSINFQRPSKVIVFQSLIPILNNVHDD